MSLTTGHSRDEEEEEEGEEEEGRNPSLTPCHLIVDCLVFIHPLTVSGCHISYHVGVTNRTTENSGCIILDSPVFLFSFLVSTVQRSLNYLYL